MKGTITVELEGVTLEETERCRKIIHALFEEGLFTIKGGSFTANFDEVGEMLAIEKRVVRRRNKPIVAEKLLEQFKIEVLPVNGANVTVARKAGT